MGGAKIQDLKKKVMEEVKEMDERSLLVVQGEGNNLESAGTDETVKEVVEAVKAAEDKCDCSGCPAAPTRRQRI